jgi:hypothetical protein
MGYSWKAVAYGGGRISGKYPAPGKRVLPILLLAGAVNPAFAQNAPLAKQRMVSLAGEQYLLTSRLKAVVLGDFTYGYNHVDGTRNLDSTLTRVGRAEGWTVDRINSANEVTTEKLAKYQVFFGNYISNWPSPFFPIAGRDAVQDFVETKGNGLFLMHPGEGGESPDWKWYRDYAVPCRYASEAGRDPASTGRVGVFKGYRNNPGAKGHPIMEDIQWDGGDSATWINNELHYFDKPILDSSITPARWQGLLSLNAATCGKPNTCGITHDYAAEADGNFPLAWTFPLKKGNIGYFTEGHDLTTMASMTQPVWDRFFKQFLYYIAGYDTVKIITAIAPPGSGTGGAAVPLSLDPCGVTFHPGAAPGVLITKAGDHIVALYDLSGRKIREERSRVSPIDYDFGPELAGKPGVYVMRVAVHGKMRSAKALLR